MAAGWPAAQQLTMPLMVSSMWPAVTPAPLVSRALKPFGSMSSPPLPHRSTIVRTTSAPVAGLVTEMLRQGGARGVGRGAIRRAVGLGQWQAGGETCRPSGQAGRPGKTLFRLPSSCSKQAQCHSPLAAQARVHGPQRRVAVGSPGVLQQLLAEGLGALSGEACRGMSKQGHRRVRDSFRPQPSTLACQELISQAMHHTDSSEASANRIAGAPTASPYRR